MCTFGHLLQQTEDGTPPDEVSGPEEMHGGRKGGPRHLPLLHFEEADIQLLLGISQDHLPTGLHGGLQLDESLPLPGVRDGHRVGQEAENQTQLEHHDGKKRRAGSRPVQESAEELTFG